MSEAFSEFVQSFVGKYQPLHTRASEAWWEAATTGRPEAYRREAGLRREIESLLSDPESFAFLESARGSNDVTDPVDRRLLEVLYLSYLGRQCSTDLLREIVDVATEVEAAFATFRPEVDGRRLTGNEIERILVRSRDPGERRRAWEASKEIGPVVGDRVRKLVRLRTRAARELGFDNYYALSLTLSEQSPGEITTLFDELDRRTRDPYRRKKRRLDEQLFASYGIGSGDLRPWHYADPFFQEVPEPPELCLDELYAENDLLDIATRFFSRIGLDVRRIIERSDVYEREGKNQHAFCIDVDREGDIRVLLNLKPTARWMSSVMHELGHGVYDGGIRRELPFPLRRPAHTFVTEGVAMLFGRMPYTFSWLQGMEILDDRRDGDWADSLRTLQAARQLVFSRWCQVMVRFESALYAEPDADLNDIWWRLVERYQELGPPEGRVGEDWATKSHIVSTPVYYHNYAIGEMFASQLLEALLDFLALPRGDEGSVLDRPEAGRFLTESVFAYGAAIPWAVFVESVTGTPLTVEPFVRQFAT